MKGISKVGVLFAVFCALGAVAVPAKADVATIRDSNNTIWGSMGGHLLNYKEPGDPLPDSQHGWLPSFAVGVNYMGRSDLYLAADASVSIGEDHYNGAVYNSGTGEYDIPFDHDSRATISTVNLRAGKGFALGHNVMVTPYVDLGFRFWERDVVGYVEDYRNFEGLAGAMLQYSPVRRLTFTLYGEAGSTFGSEMESDSVEFSLGNSVVYKVGGKVGYDISNRFQIFTALDFTHFHYTRSDWEQVDNYWWAYEPNSNTTGTTLRVGLAYHYK